MLVLSGSGTGSSQQQAPAATTAVTPAGGVTTTQVTAVPTVKTTTRTTTAAVTTVPTSATTTAVPETGVAVRIYYIGAFTGSYGDDSQTYQVSNSGSRIYTLDNAKGTVTASFKKSDSSTRHTLTVEIYKNGILQKSGSTSDSYGFVTLSTTV